MATYLTGDTHGNFLRVDTFCRAMETTKSDTIIILGDAGFNYYLNAATPAQKSMPAPFRSKFFSIHGNHEARPQRIPSYMEGEYCGGEKFSMRKHFRTSSLLLTARFTISMGTSVS